MKTSTALFGLALSVPLVFSLLSGAAAQSYNFTDFDASGSGLATTVNSISNSGVVVGSYLNVNATNTNFSGTPPVFNPLNLSDTASANGINSSNQIVGSDGGGGAFLLDSNGLTTLPLVDSTEASQAAFGINDGGVIVGQYFHSDGIISSGFVGSGSSFSPIDPTGAAVNTSAQAINDNGLVTGFYGTSGNPSFTHGFLFDTKTSAYTLLNDPVANDLASTQFLGINDSGEAVGYYQTNTGAQHGFLYNTHNTATNAYTFLNDPNTPTVGAPLMQITGITNSGEIAGFYTDANQNQRGFIAMPAAAVPEASSVVSLSLLLLLGAGGLWAAKRRKVA